MSDHTRREVIRLVDEAWFDAIESRYFFHWLVPPKWVLGLAEHALGVRHRHPRIPPRSINALLYGFSRMEEGLVRPFGGIPGSSILLVALART